MFFVGNGLAVGLKFANAPTAHFERLAALFSARRSARANWAMDSSKKMLMVATNGNRVIFRNVTTASLAGGSN